MEVLGITPRRRRISSVIVLVCFVADLVRHHSAASATGVVDELTELGSRDVGNDENELLAAAKG